MILGFFRLIRINNLFIILATMYLLRYLVIDTWLKVALSDWGFVSGLSDSLFFLLVMSVVLVAAAGYAINDYFDINIDNINKPDQLVAGRIIGKDKVIIMHFIMNIAGIALGFFVASSMNFYKLGFVHVITAAGLWFYSSSFKKQLLIGNIIVALAVAMVPLTVAIFEFPLLLDTYQRILAENEQLFNSQPELDVMIAGNLHGIGRFILIVALFSFLMTLIRELIKDMQDMEGDSAFGSKSLPLVFGIRTTKIVICSLIVITIGVLGYIMNHQFPTDKVSFGYFLFALIIPLSVLLYVTYKSHSTSHYKNASRLSKGIMLAGLFYTLIYNYLLRH